MRSISSEILQQASEFQSQIWKRSASRLGCILTLSLVTYTTPLQENIPKPRERSPLISSKTCPFSLRSSLCSHRRESIVTNELDDRHPRRESKRPAQNKSRTNSSSWHKKVDRRKQSAPGKQDTTQTWRIFGIEVHPDDLSAGLKDEEKDSSQVPICKKLLHPAVLRSLCSRLRLTHDEACTRDHLPPGLDDVRVVRRSLDARIHKRRPDGSFGPRFVFVLDVDITPGKNVINEKLQLKNQPGRIELLLPTNQQILHDESAEIVKTSENQKTVIIVGAGPAGLFCALQLARAGVKPIVLERGQPVESRGRDIGALMHRRSLDSDSNFAFGEGGAGTWSDGKLTTRIGRNSDAVRFVLDTLVQFGAPEKILVDGAPHLGTENLVRLVRNMRAELRRLGGEIRFGTKVIELIMDGGTVQGVKFVRKTALERNIDVPAPSDEEVASGHMYGNAVVLATGHSARDMYESLHKAGVELEPKGFAVGFRVEHPQKLINKIQFGTVWGSSVVTGKRQTDVVNEKFFASFTPDTQEGPRHRAHLPVPSYRLATDQAFDGNRQRGVYSFCMCPGGQIVPASTDPGELCVNGMSFSRRDSQWANSALVVTVSPDDTILDPYRVKHGVLAGLAFQRDMEQRAWVLGGGNLTVPVQRLTDFVAGRPSTSAPSSSYRLGIKPAACHDIFPAAIVASMRSALLDYFEKQMPGFVCDEGLLHGVETRTSSPVRIPRNCETMQANGVQGLYPAGEGAGFAGGIVSAAVDGMTVSEAVLSSLFGKGDFSGRKGGSGATKGMDSFY